MAISNGCDLSMWLRMMTIEMITGLFLREVIGARNGYSIISPFGYAPGISEVRTELGELITETEETDEERSKKDQEQLLTEKTLREKLFTFDREQIDLCKLLALTDSANAYASLVSGHPAPNERRRECCFATFAIYSTCWPLVSWIRPTIWRTQERKETCETTVCWKWQQKPMCLR